MISQETFTGYVDAFNLMHKLTYLNQPFKLEFRKVNGEHKIITKALLRKQTPTAADKMGAYKINYIDELNDQCGTAYIPLLLAVNDIKIILR